MFTISDAHCGACAALSDNFYWASKSNAQVPVSSEELFIWFSAKYLGDRAITFYLVYMSDPLHHMIHLKHSPCSVYRR